jgi:hypothetical protein
MHPLIEQRRAVLGALMQRTAIARGEFALRVNAVMPEKAVRFQVVIKGPKAYHIVDLVTDKTRAFRFDYGSAVDIAIQLEAMAARKVPGGQP